MQDFGTKADNSPPPGGQLSAAEFNNLATENENAVLRSGQTLSGASATQLAQSLFLHSVKAETFQDSGLANAYVATPVSGTNGVLLPGDYANMGGAKVVFKASNANTAAATLNIGQTTGTLLGTKAIVDQSGAALTGGEIKAGKYAQLIYDPSIGAGSWVLLPWAAGLQLAGTPLYLTASGPITKRPGVTRWFVRQLGGGGQGGGTQATGASQVAAGGGGSSGSYAEAWFDVTALVSATLAIGAGGSAAAAGASGSTGGTTTLTMGANSLTCPGGPGGLAGAATASIPNEGGSAAAFSATPTHVGALSFSPTPGGGGTSGLLFTLAAAQPGNGGPTAFGSSRAIGGSSGNAVGFGAGGTGARSLINTAANNGFFGANGLCIIEEYF